MRVASEYPRQYVHGIILVSVIRVLVPPHVGDPRQEQAAHRIAWAAVKRRYVKLSGEWVTRP
jgi:hypothetical protein